MSITTLRPAEADVIRREARTGGRRLTVAVLAGILLMLALAPIYMSDAWLSMLGKAYIAALFALSFNMLFGQAGMLSFGHAAYYGLGAFAAVHLMNAVERGLVWVPTPLIPLAGAVIGALMGVIAGVFAGRRSGVYFAMVTLALSELLYTLAPNLHELFGGESGISSYRSPFMMFNFGRESHVYTMVLGWFILCAILIYAMTGTLFGRLAVALRESEARLPALGYNVYWTKVFLFALSGLFAGVAGALLAVSTESANYFTFAVGNSAAVVLQTFIGGSSIFLGPVVGAGIMTLFGYVVSDLTRAWLLYQGLIFITLMLLAPKGIAVLAINAASDVANHGARAVKRLAVVLAGILLITFGVVLMFEILSAVLTRDYQVQIERGAGWGPVGVFWTQWRPLSPLTWLVIVVPVSAGVLIARRATRTELGSEA
ncbi:MULTISPECIES: branched-chain amino acid ABC transporter permease [unclassified Chelatococcus]|uniref:branched-chain amino acid ABC transporter permease n=1 Tax=unclassified Chelatococcus TaxID=2638111 RepID=UPI001BCD55CE|nr:MULTISPECIES: branched-chain amino acid ABC transporter permease [unclassified Chelatococcus]CAH1654281.1 Branched-chain amino acid ABC transporter permease [Hyphomicrobiales bacterium]MBS7742802.1 branched-chain amino acid ABC transporter permease [Chelatococcus sp. HY11]MBX3542080.1 branched-chain amino acid ABC transporter permease [Chelatococcus sp.]MCO5074028.1 branched-chain amino acid ABC transporter permease [Chelatococcus sp.]CAH1694847.1 Branched-chain amino acid ABC transporter p